VLYSPVINVTFNAGLEIDFSGNTSLITGGSSGIGFEFAKQLSQMGNTVIVTGRNKEKLAKA
jgi:short-subunit dehydrogenase involved in D-alanine esterification of teichoic acids